MKKLRLGQPRRSFIFTPPLKKDMFIKAINSKADIVCLELEDGISPRDKNKARKLALQILKNNRKFNNVEKLIRINSINEVFGLMDIKELLESDCQPDGIMIPKVKTAEEIILLDNLFSEKKLATKFHVIIETNQGLKNVHAIAESSNRVEALFFGAVDMSAELRCKNKWDSLLFARSKVVHAAASKGIDVIDVPFLDLEDLDAMKEEAIKAKELGFSGKGAIHPKQINVLNSIFTPSKIEIEKAKNIIKLFESSKSGLVLFEGKLIEKPVLREMYRVLNIANKVKKNSSRL